MTIENKYRRVAEDAPDRCQSTGGQGQCHYAHTENSKYCPMHGGNSGEAVAEKDRIRKYRIAIWQSRVNEFADSPQVKSLREEIGVLSLLLEETLKRCNDTNDVLLFSNKIGDLVMKIKDVVLACHKLDQSTGQLLDRSAALNFAAQIVEIITDEVKNPEIVDRVSKKIIESLASLSKEPLNARQPTQTV